jgi:hypothetical protein
MSTSQAAAGATGGRKAASASSSGKYFNNSGICKRGSMRGLLRRNISVTKRIATMPLNSPASNAAGLAALGICESLLLAMTDLKLISAQDAHNILTDVMTTNSEAATLSATPERHLAVVEIIGKILAGRNGTPR